LYGKEKIYRQGKKSFALKHLSRLADDLLDTSVGYELDDEDEKQNNKDLNEIEAALEWIKRQ
jgi:hypothetical protein